MSPLPEAVIFDLDGTLVLSENRNRLTWAAFFAGNGIEADEALLTYVAGRRGRDVAVVTSAHRVYTEAVLRDLGLRELFTTVVTADDVQTGKPDPEGHLLARSRSGIDPARALAFEDSPAGVTAVKAAGLHCIGVTTTQSAAALAACDAVVGQLTDVDWPPEAAA